MTDYKQRGHETAEVGAKGVTIFATFRCMTVNRQHEVRAGSVAESLYRIFLQKKRRKWTIAKIHDSRGEAKAGETSLHESDASHQSLRDQCGLRFQLQSICRQDVLETIVS